jgi:hypothetical protein
VRPLESNPIPQLGVKNEEGIVRRLVNETGAHLGELDRPLPLRVS